MDRVTRDDIDILSAAINGDQQAVIKDQLERVQREIVERLAINIQIRDGLHEIIDDLRRDILAIEPRESMPDDPTNRHERYILKREWRQLILRLMDEQRVCWHERQALLLEARGAEKQLLTLHQRDRRLSEF